ncbi:diacylglycerol kinase family protein [Actinoplanes sp. NPDC051475]|uniref:diacylglycerol/lipid kinase family protein n=1 Tax=Actinoplanes sp. NPDC051475 TaxID=3157225 RepID=UPI0034510CD5
MRETFTAVVNPAAGAGTAAATMITLARALRESGAWVRVTYSRGLKHATELAAAAAARGETVLAAGGDGMVGAVAAGLIGTAADFGVVPAGRGNDLARAVPLPRDDPAAFAAALRERPSRPVDVAMVGDRVVLGSVCAGLDAAANAAANRWRLPRRPIAYQIAAAGVLARWRPVTYDLVVDGQPQRLVGNTVVVANCAWYGGALRVAPAARLDDGLLDLVTIGEMGRRRLVPVLAAMRRGEHVTMPGIASRPVREVTIATDRPTPFYADGEPLPPGPATVTVRPGALRMIGA